MILGLVIAACLRVGLLSVERTMRMFLLQVELLEELIPEIILVVVVRLTHIDIVQVLSIEVVVVDLRVIPIICLVYPLLIPHILSVFLHIFFCSTHILLVFIRNT